MLHNIRLQRLSNVKHSNLLVYFESYQCLYRDRLVIPECKHNMTSLRGQASWAKMTSLRGKLTALAWHPTKFVNKSEQRTYHSTNIESYQEKEVLRIQSQSSIIRLTVFLTILQV
jgi:hypothetical protein